MYTFLPTHLLSDLLVEQENSLLRWFYESCWNPERSWGNFKTMLSNLVLFLRICFDGGLSTRSEFALFVLTDVALVSQTFWAIPIIILILV